MLSRCLNPKRENYPRYGARGITVCERWRKFENFLADMGERPNGKTLDRIEGRTLYAKQNCRWATSEEQSANRINVGRPKSYNTGQMLLIQFLRPVYSDRQLAKMFKLNRGAIHVCIGGRNGS